MSKPAPDTSAKRTLTSTDEVERKGIPKNRQARLRMRKGAICPFIAIGRHIFYVDWDDWVASQIRTHTRDRGVTHPIALRAAQRSRESRRKSRTTEQDAQ